MRWIAITVTWIAFLVILGSETQLAAQTITRVTNLQGTWVGGQFTIWPDGPHGFRVKLVITQTGVNFTGEVFNCTPSNPSIITSCDFPADPSLTVSGFFVKNNFFVIEGQQIAGSGDCSPGIFTASGTVRMLNDETRLRVTGSERDGDCTPHIFTVGASKEP